MSFIIDFSPLLPWPAAVALISILAAVLIWAASQKLVGWPLRTAAGALIAAVLLNPQLRLQERVLEPNQVILVVDNSASQTVGNREAQTIEAVEAIKNQLAMQANVEVIEVSVRESPQGYAAETRLLGALNDQLGNIDSARLASAVIVTDGRISNEELDAEINAPVHVLQTGSRIEFDREISLIKAPAYAVIGEEATFEFTVGDLGSAAPDAAGADVRIYLNGELAGAVKAKVGSPTTLALVPDRAGLNRIRFETSAVDGELTELNNVATVTVNGVRDRLRVLLVSGLPHAGQRSWRNILKSDSSVDLIHFTVLRTLRNRQPANANDLALIPFPVQELFVEKIDSFDAIIFDRFSRFSLNSTHFWSIRDYVERGGALFVAAGPEFANPDNLASTAISEILPAVSNGEVIEQGFWPRVTELGMRHPVVSPLADEQLSVEGTDRSSWGRWFRQIGLNQLSGQAVLSGPDDRPLLILDRVGLGRVGLLASDQAWLWQRGVEGGGPIAELLRRVVHWLIQEPELEEEALRVFQHPELILIKRSTLSSNTPEIRAYPPEGESFEMSVEHSGFGQYRAEISSPVLGLWRFESNGLQASFYLGPDSPIEYRSVISTEHKLAPLADASGGGVFWLEDGIPELRMVRPSRTAFGPGWLGIEEKRSYRTISESNVPLIPPIFAAGLILFFATAAWFREGR